jgi:hypothetical protein
MLVVGASMVHVRVVMGSDAGADPETAEEPAGFKEPAGIGVLRASAP